MAITTETRSIPCMLTKLIKFLLLDDSTYFSFNMLYVNISFYTKISKNEVERGDAKQKHVGYEV